MFLNAPTELHNSNKMSENNQSAPILSVLVPAYNYSSGVRQIVCPLLDEGRNDLEILIHDDSSDYSVEHFVKSILPKHANLKYRRNRPALGAIDNWNSLINAALGRYVILIHHDDFPLSKHFATELINELQARKWPDAMVLACVTHDVARNKVRPCIHNRIRQIIIRKWPTYLFLRNVIGPPAAIVVRRNIFLPFDNQLKWLVDIDAYYRLLIQGNRRVEFSHLVIVSSTGLPNAITTGIQGRKGSIRNAELAQISAKFPPTWFWKVIRGRVFGAQTILLMEWFLWVIIRVLSSILNRLSGSRIDLLAVLRRKKYAG